MGGNETPKKKETNTVGPPEDDPLLRIKREDIDKTIGSEGQQLADKRAAAIKRAHEMPSA
jgi:hypothetical protein